VLFGHELVEGMLADGVAVLKSHFLLRRGL